LFVIPAKTGNHPATAPAVSMDTAHGCCSPSLWIHGRRAVRPGFRPPRGRVARGVAKRDREL